MKSLENKDNPRKMPSRSTNVLSTNAGLLLLALLINYPTTVHAQSVDSCMSAPLGDALTICQSILDSGSRNADVYWRLSSAQFQNAQPSLAKETLTEALRLHPGNPKLQTLKDIIDSDSTEQALIARSAQLNQSSIDKGAMKITCLTKTGELAISACTRRLELTDVDGERIRKRLASVKEAQSAAQLATASVSAAPVIPAPAPSQASQPLVTTPEATLPSFQPPTIDPLLPTAAEVAENARRAAYGTLVTDVQTRLNDFGLNAGLPDGVPGNRTREALRTFYSAVGKPVITSISDQTLDDLVSAKYPYDSAESLLQESQLALTDGNLALAVQKLTQAKNTSGLITIPDSLEREIQSSLIAEQPGVPQKTTASNPVPESSSEKPAQSLVVPASTGSMQDMEVLMSRIQILQGQIKRQQAEQARQLKRLREAF